MPRAWSDKDERQYEHIKDSSLERGVNEDKAEEIAARTVNKHRRVEGRTPNVRSQGTGNPNRALEERSRDEIYNRAKELKIRGRSTMSKAELVEAVRAEDLHGIPHRGSRGEDGELRVPERDDRLGRGRHPHEHLGKALCGSRGDLSHRGCWRWRSCLAHYRALRWPGRRLILTGCWNRSLWLHRLGWHR